MSQSDPTQNVPRESKHDSAREPLREPLRALGSGRDNPAPPTASPPLRGEIFDVTLDQNGEIERPPAMRRTASAPWFLAGLAALFFVYNVGAYVGQKSKVPAPIGPFTPKNEAARALRIQVVGRVKKPGVYTLSGGARVEDAIKKAGGSLPGADLDALNLADWATDGSKIEVPAKLSVQIVPTPTPQVIIKEVFITPPQNSEVGVVERPQEASAPTPGRSPNSAPRTVSAAINDGIPRDKTASGGKSSNAALDFLRKNPVDLNRASAEQLAILPGVGPKMAERILAYRKESGGFKGMEDLDNVRGIGEKRLEILKDLVKFKSK